MKTSIGRREFLRLASASAASASVGGCFAPLSRTNALLAGEPEGPLAFGEAELPTHFESYRGLAELPFFELDADGRLRCVADAAFGAIDFHTHLGMSYLFASDVDLQRRTPTTSYIFDCDGDALPCLLNFNIYQNQLASQEILDQLRWELVRSGLPGGSPAARTHTIPNLLAEMDAMGLERVVVLPVAIDLPFNNDPTEQWLTQARASAAPERLVMFGSVLPGEGDAIEKLRRYKTLGVHGIKLHPPLQHVYPDADESMAVYQECDRLGLPILFHSGRAGIEPESAQRYAEMKHYWAPVTEFPNLRFIFGHAGCRLDADEALAIAKEHPNVWLEISGQGLPHLEKMLQTIDADRILYGTDWPFYPLAPALAKVLMVTAHDQTVTRMILRENALRFLGEA